ncbi:MAG: BsaWI family type II restriction enzyme, partial [Dehalococcoidales bacterium]
MLDQLAQSLRAAGGTAFEYIVAKILNSFLLEDDIVVTRAREASLRRLIHDQSNIYQIMDFTRVPVKRRCDQSQLQDYPDLDLFALIRPSKFGQLWRLLAIINCKVSFHARHTEAAFWGLLVRLSSNIPFVVVTEDRDIYKPKPSELGRSCQESTETRRILESFSDRVYLIKRYDNENDPKLGKD